MWDLATINKLNAEAYRLAIAGLPERDAMMNIGIRVCGNTPRGIYERRDDNDSSGATTYIEVRGLRARVR